jgi:hypothetical protein
MTASAALRTGEHDRMIDFEQPGQWGGEYCLRGRHGRCEEDVTVLEIHCRRLLLYTCGNNPWLCASPGLNVLPTAGPSMKSGHTMPDAAAFGSGGR